MALRKSILITGASGLIGARLTTMLLQKGHQVFQLGRTERMGSVKTFRWDIDKGLLDDGTLKSVDTIINLAGAGIADKRWTKNRKQEVLKSRTDSVKLLATKLNTIENNVTTFLAASAIGYYGADEPDRVFKESDPPGNDFLADVTRQWEAEADKISSSRVRVVKVRIGIVLSEEGGALKEMAKPVKWFVGASLGTGTQPVSWIHIDDLCRIFIRAVEDNQMKGTFNAVAPSPTTNSELTKLIAKLLKKPLILPAVPAFALKLMLGEMAEMVLKGNKVSSEKIQSTGFEFKFPTLESALEDLLH